MGNYTGSGCVTASHLSTELYRNTPWLVARHGIDFLLLEHKLTIAMQWFGTRTQANASALKKIEMIIDAL